MTRPRTPSPAAADTGVLLDQLCCRHDQPGTHSVVISYDPGQPNPWTAAYRHRSGQPGHDHTRAGRTLASALRRLQAALSGEPRYTYDGRGQPLCPCCGRDKWINARTCRRCQHRQKSAAA